MTNIDAIPFLRQVRNVRRFLPDPLPDDVLTGILEVARWTGSARNSQPWELIVVRDREKLVRLSQAGGNVGALANAPVGIVIALHAPPEVYDQSHFDEGRLAERILIATALGAGCGIAWFKGEGGANARAILGIPADREVRTVIYLGYPDPQNPSGRPPYEQPRKPLAEIVSLDRYGQPLP